MLRLPEMVPPESGRNPLATKPVVAICAEAVPTEAVGAVGTPEKAGEIGEAAVALTKPVVARRVELSALAWVGAIGLPVKAGDASAAKGAIALDTVVSTYCLVAAPLGAVGAPDSSSGPVIVPPAIGTAPMAAGVVAVRT